MTTLVKKLLEEEEVNPVVIVIVSVYFEGMSFDQIRVFDEG